MEERLTRLQAKLEADESWAEKLFGLETAEQVQGFKAWISVWTKLIYLGISCSRLCKQVNLATKTWKMLPVVQFQGP